MPCQGAHPIEGDDSLYECIYCRTQAERDAFNREHVLSNAFGGFSDALVLHQYVCKRCNKFFADGIERELTRDAFEAMLRYQKRIKKPSDGPIRMSYVEVAVPEGKAWSGIRLQLVGNAGDVVFRPSPQVGALDTNGRWIHLTAEEIQAGLIDQHSHFKFKGVQLRVFAATPQEHAALVCKLAEHGINYAQSGALQTPDEILGSCEPVFEVTFTLNTNLRRCIAKYAFNYLACSCGGRFALAPEFDAARNFVRYGIVPDYPIVTSSFKPILFDDQPTTRQTDGHLITLSWDESLRSAISQVSIFNHITYDVVLCQYFDSMLWRQIRSGHHYDIQEKVVKPLFGFAKYMGL